MKKNRKSRIIDYLTVYFMTKMSDSYKSKVRRAFRLATDLYRSLDEEKKETLHCPYSRKRKLYKKNLRKSKKNLKTYQK